jgi:6-phosphogluconolactonase
MHPHELAAASNLVICHDPDELADQAAETIEQAAREAVGSRGRFTLVLSGGSTPLKTYLVLAHTDRPAPVDWGTTFIFFSDERFVPAEDPRSNYGLAQKSFLGRVKIPPSHVYPMPTGEPSAAEAAERYSTTLAKFFSAPEGTAPRFDLILLGVGEDGHTASLFPHGAALTADAAWATWSPPGNASPRVDRITLTYPVLNAARHVVFLVAGINKAAILRDALAGNARREDLPAAGVRPVDGQLTWLVDEDAAGELNRI